MEAEVRTLQVCQILGALRIVPSPEQGTSQRIRSNLSCRSERLPPSSPAIKRGGKRRASWLVTMQLLAPQARSWWIMVEHRFAFTSLATTIPSPSPIACRICRVFEPGDAHKSSTSSAGLMASNGTGIMLTASWYSINPSEANTSSCSLSLEASELSDDTRTLAGSCHALPPGPWYQSIKRREGTSSPPPPCERLLQEWSSSLASCSICRCTKEWEDGRLILKVTGRRVFKHAMKSLNSPSGTIPCL
mmetsp:Transcript_42039/g.132497  ORF Transcript_42039/g.132497 Transcript_42039/m.132497 type:complete len:247 (-) Transcript_42039:164-904(-)